MKLSTKGRYAARAILDLALNFNKKPVLLKDIAKRQDISVRYLEQIMASLVLGGLVSGIRGKKGGFMLSKHPENIKLREVIALVEGPLFPVLCVVNPSSCGRTAACVTHEIWKQVESAITGVLDSYTLKDMIEMQKKKNELSEECMYYI
jgi:Rrf2 family protein